MIGRRTALFALVAVGVLGQAPAQAADRENRPVITGAKVYVADGMILSSVNSTGLFSEEIVGTVQSGLPAVVELAYSLVDRHNEASAGGLHMIELRYDVWENVYSMAGLDSTRRFSSFAAMAGAVQHLRRVAIVPLRDCGSNTEFAIRFSVAIHALQSLEKKEIAGWVGEHVRDGSEGSIREQVLNLNDLIEHFFSREKDSANQSDWYRTEFFNPVLLPSIEEEGE